MRALTGKKAIITGGAMGIGLATARRLLREGCEITLWDLDAKALSISARELETCGGPLHCHACDITDEERVRDLAQKAKDEMGHVDILINNAGHVKAARFCSQPTSVWVRSTQVNLIAMYTTIAAFLPEMYARNSGHIVNISSGAGLVGLPDLAVYCATKWAVYGLTESLRLEALADGKKGVRFSSIHPGIVKHGMFEGGKFNPLGEILLPRLNSHDDIAEVIVERALKRGHCMVMRPRILHIGLIARALLPDLALNYLLLAAGAGHAMQGWVGRNGSPHASR